MATTFQWFKPPFERSDKWFDFTYYFQFSNSIMYAQTFVNSPIDQDVVLRSGCSGSIKIWVNDNLATNIAEERNCDLDIYANTVHLKKGYNRVLVQIGESEANRANFLIRFTDDNLNLIQGLTSTDIEQPYSKDASFKSKDLPFWAETFFEDKIKAEPDNILNYILLAENLLTER